MIDHYGTWILDWLSCNDPMDAFAVFERHYFYSSEEYEDLFERLAIYNQVMDSVDQCPLLLPYLRLLRLWGWLHGLRFRFLLWRFGVDVRLVHVVGRGHHENN